MTTISKNTILTELKKGLESLWADGLFRYDILEYMKTSDNSNFFKTACYLSAGFLKNYEAVQFNDVINVIQEFTNYILSRY